MLEFIAKNTKSWSEIWSLHEHFFELVDKYPVLGAILIAIFIGGVSYTTYKLLTSFVEDIMKWIREPLGALLVMTATVAIVGISLKMTGLILEKQAPAPEFAPLKPVFVGKEEIPFLHWSYKPPEGSEPIAFELESEDNINFLHPHREGYKRATVNSWPITEQINGIRYYRLRAVKSGTKAELSRWSVPAKLEQYSNAIERVRSNNGKLKVFVSQSEDQGVFRFDKPEYDGFDIRLVARIEEELRRRLSISAPSLDNGPKVEAVPWEQLLSAPKEQGADVIISSITASAQREETYGLRFTLPYYCITQSLVYREEKKPERLKKALQGKLIGVQKGTTSESLLNDIRREAGTEAFKIEGFADTSLIFEALSERRIDYGVMDSSFATTGLMRYGTLHRSEFTPEDMPMGRQSVEKYALAVKSSEKELLEYINLILGELRDTKQIDELFRSAANDFIKTVIKGEIRGVNHVYPLLPSSCEEISRTP